MPYKITGYKNFADIYLSKNFIIKNNKTSSSGLCNMFYGKLPKEREQQQYVLLKQTSNYFQDTLH